MNVRAKPFPIEGALIVLADHACRQAEIGADEINGQVKTLGGKLLAIRREGDLTDDERDGANVILVGRPGKNKMLADQLKRSGIKLSPDDPGPQGYCIRFVTDGKRRLALLAGCDRVGMLYACVTFRQLLRQQDGTLSAVAADIRDWPDALWRFTWTTLRDWERIASGWHGKRPPAQPKVGVAAAKAGIDWLLRQKINVFKSEYACRRDGTERMHEEYREVFRYAFERGVWGFARGVHGNLGHVPVAEVKPEHKVCFHYERHGKVSCWCWSRDEMMERTFENCARDMAASMPTPAPETGGILILLHLPDTGNMGWHKRCDQCRKRFGNDQAAAQANVFNHFYKAVRRHIPNSRLVFVPRPYHAMNLDHPLNKVYADRIEKLATLVPKDSFLVHTQTSREAVESWKRRTSNIHLAHWVNGTGRWLDMYFRFNRTYHFDRGDAIFQGGNYEPSAIEILGAVQTMWNADAPGTVALRQDKEQPYEIRRWSDAGDTFEDVKTQKAAFANLVVDGVPFDEWMWLPGGKKAGPEAMTFIKKAVAAHFGEDAAPYMLRILTPGPLDRYIDDPLHYAHTSKGGYDTPEVMATQVRAFEEAATAAEEMWTRRIELKPGVYAGGVEVQGLSRPAHGFAISVHYVSMFHTRLAQGKVWLHILEARKAQEEGDAQRASACIETAARELEQQTQRLRDVFARLKKAERYKNEVSPSRLKTAITMLEKVRPQIETVRVEVNLKQNIRRFNEMPFGPHYQSGKMRIAVYMPPREEGSTPGGEGILQTLSNDAEIEATPLRRLSLGLLRKHDVLVFPSCSRMPASDLKRVEEVRRYVGSYGGGVYVQHVSVGSKRFPLRSSMFPEVGQCAGRLDSNRVKVAQKHPLVAGHKLGELLIHMYFDHMALDLRGASGKAVLVDADTGQPIVAVGQVGKGRVVLDGTIAYASPTTEKGKALAENLGKEKDFEHPAFGISRELLLNGVRWLCGKSEELP